MLTVDLVRRGARHHGPRVAMEYRGRSLTFADVDELSNRLANALIAHGVTAKAPVGLLVDNGAPDDTWVEAVTAFVVVRPGAEATDDELRQVVRDRLAAYKVPKRIERLDAIPKSAVGKLLRRAVRDPLSVGRSRPGATK